MWIQIAIILISLLINRAKSGGNAATRDAFGDGDFPTADEGTPQYVVHGDCWSADWCVVAWGNQRSQKIKKGGGLLSKAQVIGYRYYATVQMALGRGPLNILSVITVGDKYLWSGNVTASTSFVIDKFYLFGGDEGQGGISGGLWVMMGEPTQQPPALLQQILGDSATGCRGVTTLLFNGLLCSVSKSPQAWKVRHSRTTQGWDGDPWYPAKALVMLRDEHSDMSFYPAAQQDALRNIHAMNGAHMLVELATNQAWGRGCDIAELDLASYQAAADTLYAEGFGLCLRYTRDTDLDQYAQKIINHIGAAQFVSRSTGLLTLRLIRDDYDVDSLPVFTFDTGLLVVEEQDTSSDDALNQYVVNWQNPVTNKTGQARARNPGGLIATGGVVSDSGDFEGLPTFELAQQVADRELRARCGGIRQFKVTLDRRGYTVEPGGVFRIQAPQMGLDDIVLRAAKLDVGKLIDGKIVITCAQDVFGLQAARISAPNPSAYVPPSTTAIAAPAQRLFELGYRDLARAMSAGDLAVLDATRGYVAMIGKRPSSLTQDFELDIGTPAYADVGEVDCTPYARLATAMPAEAGPTHVSLVDLTDMDQVTIGTAAWLDNELVRIDALNADAGTATLARGCGDTVPAQHDAAAELWCYDDAAGADPTSYANGTHVYGKLITRTSTDVLDASLAPASDIVLSQRAIRPYPPGNLRINGAAYPATANGALALSWAHRDRLLQGDQLIDTTQSSIGPEANTTYTVRIYLGGVLQATQASVAGSSLTIPVLAGDGSVRVEIDAVRDGYTSWQTLSATFDYTRAAPLVTESGVQLTTEDGNPFILES